MFEGNRYIKYEPAVRQLYYDNHTETWNLKVPKDADYETLSAVKDGRMNRKRLNAFSLR